MAVLEELHIQNFAIIDDLSVQFKPGLNVLTGETGAGKSILIGAIQLLLGGRGAVDQIRQGADEAMVEGRFDLSGATEFKGVLESHGLPQSDQVILRRIISRTGRSRAYVNGRFCTIQTLSELGRSWINIYGQHEHQLLLQPERNLDLLDAYGDLGSIRTAWEKNWRSWGELKKEIEEGEARRREAETMKELWEFQCSEIERANLFVGEEEALEQDRQVLSHAHRIQEGLHQAEDAIYGERGSALERTQMVLREMEALKRVDPEMNNIVDALSEAAVALEEGVRRIRERQRLIDLDPGRLQAVEERMVEIQRLKRKYKCEVSEILSLAESLRSRLKDLERGEQSLDELERQDAALREELLGHGKQLTEARISSGQVLSGSVERELHDLGIDHPVFQVFLSALTEGEILGKEGKHAGPKGMDQVEFLLSTNPGESARPLSRIASGGELSRIMLALKRVLAEAERIPTLIFDEIDAGIGGAVAQALGKKLNDIAEAHQVLCITHLAQIACFARHHIRVSKNLEGERTVTRVKSLSYKERVEEISRMLGGKDITERTKDHARELLQRISG